MAKTHIWLDADSCPLQVRNFLTKKANEFSIEVTFVANKNIECTNDFSFEMIICEKVKDSADNYILENAKENDLVITKDIVFASKLVEKNIACINDRGTSFTQNNIKSLLEDRDFDLQIANCGLVKHFHEGYNKEKFFAFKKCFYKIIEELLSRQETQPE